MSKYSEEEKAAFRAEEDKKIEDMKVRLLAEGREVDYELHDDFTLRRFLRARGGDLDKAYDMFTASLQWRKEHGVDTIRETAPRDNKNFALLVKYWPGRMYKTDKTGVPVYYERIGAVDVKGLVSSVPAEDITSFHIHQQEEARALKQRLSKEAGKSMYANIVVEDLAGLGMSHMYTPGIDLFKKIIAMDQNNYPDTLKVKIMGGDYKDALLEVIDEENLPEEYGGKSTCEGGCVPGGGKFCDQKDDGTSYNPLQATVGRKDTFEAKLNIDREGSTLSWEFSTKSHDIGFGVFYSPDGEAKNRETVVGSERFNAHESTVQGHLVAKRAGTYILQWDNTYSYMKSKALTYQIFISPPSESDTTA
ncbi:CRAL/TRIO domain containing protein [Acanthamoeba castellanii str. Neff]|uniref:CRAL/TRIO domain containing protein n=1 Tax=Acanthamoeba castellanii (strain ATCC 30010 / Neff) TaxID=1257118 RepID=L8GSH3_ACACF|nr:CRAL/TRIO domain containing protein [Acanthamoeba castellanii str. Neff]ELR15902.1 CRAL/TRIO domain containing protein [Acanthamoeba castellanii str. Neff]